MAGTSKGTATHTHIDICTSLTHTDAEVFVETRTSMQHSVFQQQLDVWGCRKKRIKTPFSSWLLVTQLFIPALCMAPLRWLAAAWHQPQLQLALCSSVHLQNRTEGLTWSRFSLAFYKALGSVESRCRGAFATGIPTFLALNSQWSLLCVFRVKAAIWETSGMSCRNMNYSLSCCLIAASCTSCCFLL